MTISPGITSLPAIVGPSRTSRTSRTSRISRIFQTSLTSSTSRTFRRLSIHASRSHRQRRHGKQSDQGEEQHPAPECDADAQAIVREDWYIAGAVVSVTLVDVCRATNRIKSIKRFQQFVDTFVRVARLLVRSTCPTESIRRGCGLHHRRQVAEIRPPFVH